MWAKRIALALLAVPLAYLAAALLGGLVAVNRDWAEPDEGAAGEHEIVEHAGRRPAHPAAHRCRETPHGPSSRW